MPYIKTLSTQLVSTYELLAVYYDASQLKLELSSLSTYFKGHNTTVSMEEFLKHVPAKSLFSNKSVTEDNFCHYLNARVADKDGNDR